ALCSTSSRNGGASTSGALRGRNKRFNSVDTESADCDGAKPPAGGGAKAAADSDRAMLAVMAGEPMPARAVAPAAETPPNAPQVTPTRPRTAHRVALVDSIAAAPVRSTNDRDRLDHRLADAGCRAYEPAEVHARRRATRQPCYFLRDAADERAGALEHALS